MIRGTGGVPVSFSTLAHVDGLSWGNNTVVPTVTCG